MGRLAIDTAYVEAWKKAIRRNIRKIIMVFSMLLVMILTMYFFMRGMLWKHMLIEAEEILLVAEAKIKSDFSEAEIALAGCFGIVREMIQRGDAHEEIENYVSLVTKSLKESQEGALIEYYGIYGYVHGKFLDGVGFEPDDAFNPKERPWLKAALQADPSHTAFAGPYLEWKSKQRRISLVRNFGTGTKDDPDVLGIDMSFSNLIDLQNFAAIIDSYIILLDQDLKIIMHPMREFLDKDIRTINSDYAEAAELLSQKQHVIAKKVKLETETDVLQKVIFMKQLFNGWYIGLSFPYEQFYRDINYLLAALLFVSLIFSGVIIAIMTSFDVARMRADEKSQSKTSFLAQLSHEIRTPMNAVIGMCDIALEMQSLPLMKASIGDIKRAGFNLLSIVDTIMDISKIEAGVLELRKEPYPFLTVLDDIINVIRMRSNEKKLALKVHIEKNIPHSLIGDAVRLRQILTNLLTNAVKYTNEGSISFTVSVKSREKNHITLCFEISDTGIGIKAEDISKLFITFVRLDKEKNKSVEGTGLGLFITAQLIKAMNGIIIVSSEYGKGSHFIVIIQQSISDAPVEHDKPRQTEDTMSRFTAPEARVLVVDDNPTNLKVMEGLLSLYQIQVHTCADGQTAVVLAQQHRYDIIFMDHEMAGMDGVETAKAIRALGGVFEEIPIIALTAHTAYGIKEMYIAHGFNDYLSKPIELSSINAVLTKWIHPAKQKEKTKMVVEDKNNKIESVQIEGIDTVKGAEYSNGSPIVYREILRVFLKDTSRRLAFLKEASAPENLREFSINVHALKSGSASIGASSISEQAALLERAAYDKNTIFIQENLDRFCLEIDRILENIRLFLEKTEPYEKAGIGEATDEKNSEIREEMLHLYKAIQMENVSLMDSCIKTLETMSLDRKMRETLDIVSDHVLVSDFYEAGAALKNALFPESNDGNVRG